MTRKQALRKALEALTDKETKEKIIEILDEMPFTGWSERTIFDTIDQFVIDNGRVPTATDFKKKGLPPHPVIKLRFGIDLREFLDKYYPLHKLCDSKVYYTKPKEEWQEIFISDYIQNKPVSAEEFNKVRQPDTPSWATVAGMFGIGKWLDWLDFCGLERYSKTYCHPHHTVKFNITKHHDIIIPDEYIEYVKNSGNEWLKSLVAPFLCP